MVYAETHRVEHRTLFQRRKQMGRPLNKKYFGNRNIGSTGTGDNYGIGGEGLAAYTLNAQKGSVVINSSYAEPVLVVPAPTLPTGVQATATVTWEVDTVTVTNGLAGHSYTVTTGGATTLTGLGGGATFNITAVGSGQGEVQTIVPVNRGSFTSANLNLAVGTFQIVGGDGNNQAQVKYRVKSIVTNEKGSGYTGDETFSWNDGGSHSGTMPGAPTVALTTDSGNVGSSTNQENAIVAYAYIGGSRQVVDIIRQSGSNKYTVKGASGTLYRAALVGADSAAAGEMDINALDSNGNMYYVTKLTERRARLTRKAGGSNYVYANGQTAPWSFDDATGIYIQVNNA